VPFILVSDDEKVRLRPGGSLRDIAPTMLSVLDSRSRGYDGTDLRMTSSFTMNRTQPSETKLVIAYGTRLRVATEAAMRRRFESVAGNAVLHCRITTGCQRNCRTRIFLWLLLRAEQLKAASKLNGFTRRRRRGAIDVRRAARLRNLVTNPSGIFSVPMAEHTMAVAGAGTEFPDSVRHQDHAHWSQQELWTSRST